MIRVLCLIPHPTLGASGRLRLRQYRPFLRAAGIELTLSPFLDDRAYDVLYRPGALLQKVAGVMAGFLRRARDLFRARGYDLVLIHRESAPIGPPVIERLLELMRIAYVYDFDDALFVRHIHPANRRWAWLRPASRTAETTRGARAVITGNAYLAEWAARHNRDVTIIPTPVDTDLHRPAPRVESGRLVIGWVGSTTTAPYLHLLDEVFAVLADRLDFVIRVIGGPYSHPRATVEEWPYRIESEPTDIATFDIGILPEPDDAWSRGKGAFKALLYMATGIPVVASAIGVNPSIVVDGVTGYCVSRTCEWIDRIETLARDRALRAKLGEGGRAHVLREHSVAVRAPRLAEVLMRTARTAP